MTPDERAARLANVAPGDWHKALTINASFARRMGAGKAMRPDFRAQLVAGCRPLQPAERNRP